MNKRYFWLKLRGDFFQDEAIEWLEEQKNGKEYCLFYLKLCLKALKDEGRLIRRVGNMMIPYTPEKLAEVARMKVDTVIVAMNVLQRIGLVEYLDSEQVYYLPQLQNMVGSEASNTNAQRQKKFREKKKSNLLQQGVTNSNANSNAGSNASNVADSNADVVMNDNADTVTNSNANSNAGSNASNVADNGKTVTNNNVEYRVKSIEYRDIDNNNNNYNNHHHDNKTIPDVFTLWNSNIMPITPIIGEKLQALVEEYGEAVVSDAIIKAVQYGKRNYAYVAAVARGIAEGDEKPQKEQCPF